MTTSAPALKTGDIRTRAEIRAELGGSPYGGICPSSSKKTVLLFSDHSAGAQYGYRDGWLAEKDDLGAIFEYTGAGARGDQSFGGLYGKGNSAVLEHAENGRTLHLFIAEGKISGTSTKTHRYVGAFKVDDRRPYYVRQGIDADRVQRKVIVFRLRPIAAVHSSGVDMIPPASETKAVFVRANVATSRMMEPARKRKENSLEATPVNIAARQQDELSSAYGSALSEADHNVGHMQLQIKGLTATLLTDLYDASENTLYETAGSTSREALKAALAQLLDYSRYLRNSDNPQPLRRMVLLPGLPSEDICELLAEYDVGIIYREVSTGGFAEFLPAGRRHHMEGSRLNPCPGCPALTS